VWPAGFSQPDEVAGLVTFLASGRASHIAGASIDVASGMGKFLCRGRCGTGAGTTFTLAC